MIKALSIQNLYSIKRKPLPIEGRWRIVLGEPESDGVWSIQGREKHGKTALALQLAADMSEFVKVLYVSAEEGTRGTFVDSCARVGIGLHNKNIQFLPYTPLEEVTKQLHKRNHAKIVFLDNATVYDDELKRGGFLRFREANNHVVIVLINHEERKEPATAAGKLARKLADVIFRVEGLRAQISGRVPGGFVHIHDEKAEEYGIQAISQL